MSWPVIGTETNRRTPVANLRMFALFDEVESSSSRHGKHSYKGNATSKEFLSDLFARATKTVKVVAVHKGPGLDEKRRSRLNAGPAMLCISGTDSLDRGS